MLQEAVSAIDTILVEIGLQELHETRMPLEIFEDHVLEYRKDNLPNTQLTI